MTVHRALARLRRRLRRFFRHRSRPRIVAVAGWPLPLVIAGCQNVAFGVANLGVADADAHTIHDPGYGLALDVYRPDARTDGAAPVIVFLYGGSWRRGDRASYRFVGRQLAKQGMVAIVADYRTAPSAVFPGFVEDAASAVAWARRHAAEHGGDPARVFLAGHSDVPGDPGLRGCPGVVVVVVVVASWVSRSSSRLPGPLSEPPAARSKD